MEFIGFQPRALDLLIENRMANNKDFYEAHKPDLRLLVLEPMHALCMKMSESMLLIDPSFVTVPTRIVSRIRRDTRFTKDKTLYRDHCWLEFGQPKEGYESRLVYYFEFGPQSWGYGCGYYKTPPLEMVKLRQMILMEDRRFVQAFEIVTQDHRFSLYGDMYKRPKHPEAKELYQNWLNRKNIGLSYESQDFDKLFSGEFVSEMLDDFKRIAPFYYFLRAAREQHYSDETKGCI